MQTNGKQQKIKKTTAIGICTIATITQNARPSSHSDNTRWKFHLRVHDLNHPPSHFAHFPDANQRVYMDHTSDGWTNCKQYYEWSRLDCDFLTFRRNSKVANFGLQKLVKMFTLIVPLNIYCVPSFFSFCQWVSYAIFQMIMHHRMCKTNRWSTIA